MMRVLSFLITIALVFYSAVAFAQTKSTVPRGPDGKPDLTGVWQGGSTIRGSWDEANGGLGVGGSGRNPNAPAILSSNDRPAGREAAPYQEWAAKKVMESFNKRGIDDPTAFCLPGGIPRAVMLGLYPQKIVQSPKEIVILYEYMNVFRIIPLNAKHPEDLLPSYRAIPSDTGKAILWLLMSPDSTTRHGSPAPVLSTRKIYISPNAIRAWTRTKSTTK